MPSAELGEICVSAAMLTWCVTTTSTPGPRQWVSACRAVRFAHRCCCGPKRVEGRRIHWHARKCELRSLAGATPLRGQHLGHGNLALAKLRADLARRLRPSASRLRWVLQALRRKWSGSPTPGALAWRNSTRCCHR